MNPEIVIKRYFKCLECKKGEFYLEHILENNIQSFGPWYCDQCGKAHVGKGINGVLGVETIDKRLLKNRTAILKLKHQHMILFVEHLDFSDQGDADDHDRYFYEEHQCPNNLLIKAQDVVIDGDRDNHGAFELMGIINKRDRNIDMDSWLENECPELKDEILKAEFP